MNRAATKAERLLQIEALLLTHQEGLTQAEVARRVGVSRSTIFRDLPSLPGHVQENPNGRLSINRDAYLINVRFSLHEAMAVHLASRLLATRMDRQNPHAAAALRKLGFAMEQLAPCISKHLEKSADSMDESSQWQDPNYLRSLETLTRAWAEGRKVRVWHRKDKNTPIWEYTFSPYYIEPNAIGQSTYVIGFREPPKALRTFKIERIERVEMLNECYTTPDDFQPSELFSDAWGIWYTEADPIEVVLRFSPRVAQRIGETRWHRSEQVAEQEDGSLLWRAYIAEPLEMMPWIRGWGADVEVIEPEKLRQEIVEEVCRLEQLYAKEG